MAAGVCSDTGGWASPGAGITKDYNCQSGTLRIFVVFFSGLAIYNACELILMVFLTFKRFEGAYFWSMFVAGAGIIPHATGFLLRFLDITSGKLTWLPISLITVGWYTMVTGQAFVLWSRLHLVLTGPQGDRIISLTRRMIIANIFLLHVPTTVLTYGSNGSLHTDSFRHAYNIMEKIQMTLFVVQETLLSSIYIVQTVKTLQTSLQPATRKVMQQLVAINFCIIMMDVALVSLEYASLYILEALFKGTIYSIKLKLEFVILGRLVKFVGGSKSSSSNSKGSVGFITTRKMSEDAGTMDASDFVDLDRIVTRITHPAPTRMTPAEIRWRKAESSGRKLEYAIARFEHIESVSSFRSSFSRSRATSLDLEIAPLYATGHSTSSDSAEITQVQQQMKSEAS